MHQDAATRAALKQPLGEKRGVTNEDSIKKTPHQHDASATRTLPLRTSSPQAVRPTTARGYHCKSVLGTGTSVGYGARRKSDETASASVPGARERYLPTAGIGPGASRKEDSSLTNDDKENSRTVSGDGKELGDRNSVSIPSAVSRDVRASGGSRAKDQKFYCNSSSTF